jgi:hypothetical protein
VQEYTEHKLLALDKAGNELVIDTFSFPSSCICSVTRRFQISSQVG